MGSHTGKGGYELRVTSCGLLVHSTCHLERSERSPADRGSMVAGLKLSDLQTFRPSDF